MSKYYYIVYLYKTGPSHVQRREAIHGMVSPLHPFLWLKAMNPDNKTDVGTWTILNWKEITEEEFKLLK